MAMMKMEPGFMGRAKRKAKRMSPEQMQFLQQLSQRDSIPDQRQELGMQDKMAAFNRLQEAKQSIVEAPKIYYPPDGSEPESLAYINEQEAQLLRDEAGGSGEMTEYDIPSFQMSSEERKKVDSTKKKAGPAAAKKTGASALKIAMNTGNTVPAKTGGLNV